METEKEIIQSIVNNFGITNSGQKESMAHLTDSINHLIDNDFPRLVQILYRMDISEEKLKEMLVLCHGKDSGSVILQLLMERERKKILTRAQFKRNDNIPENEKW